MKTCTHLLVNKDPEAQDLSKMGLRTNVKVFLFLRIIEGIASLSLGIFHYIAFNDKTEPTQRQLFFGLVYFGFFSISIFGACRMFKKIIKLKLEAVTTTLGYISFLTAAIVSMFNAENDPHLFFYKESEEDDHPYFRFCMIQCLMSFAVQFLFLLHLKFIVCLIKSQPSDDLSTASSTFEDEDIARPFRLYFFPGLICNRILNSLKESYTKIRSYFN